MTARSIATRPRLSIAAALGAAALFGLSVPAGKTLLAVTDPWLLAGLLYLGSGVSLGAYRLAQRFLLGRHAGEARLGRTDWPWLGAAIVTGGVIAPVLLMFGLSHAAAAEAALMLNLEGVFTAVLAWVVFREHVDRRIAAGMVAIAAGAMVLAWNQAEAVRLSGGAVLPYDYLDVGPTSTNWVDGRPLTDDAIDFEDLAVDEAGFVAREKQHGIGDVVGLAVARRQSLARKCIQDGLRARLFGEVLREIVGSGADLVLRQRDHRLRGTGDERLPGAASGSD